MGGWKGNKEFSVSEAVFSAIYKSLLLDIALKDLNATKARSFHSICTYITIYMYIV